MIRTPAQSGHLAMLAFSALVAGSFSLGALAAPLISPAAMTVARFGLVGAAAFASKGGVPRSAAAAPWRYLVLGGLLACYFVLMFEGLRTAAAVPTAAVFTLTPLMAAGFGWILLRQVTSVRMAVALALGAAGAVWVIFRGDVQAIVAMQIGKGEVIFFVGCIAHAFYAPMVRRLNRGEPALVFTFGTLLAGFLLLGLWGGSTTLATDWAHMPAIVWICLAYVSIAASAMTFVLIQYATMRLPAAKVMAYTYLVPCWVILWEMALGHSAPPAKVLAGVVLILAALGLLLKNEG